MSLLLLIIVLLIVVAFFKCYCNEGFGSWCPEESPFWRKIGMAVSDNNQYDNDEYILEELPLGGDKYRYRVTYTYGTVPPVWYLKGTKKAQNGEMRQGYVPGLKALLPGSIASIMRQRLPRFRLLIYEGFHEENCNWKRVGLAAPDYNHYEENLYILWERKFGDNHYEYKVSYIYSELPETWKLHGNQKAQNGEIRRAQGRGRSNGFLKFKLDLDETLKEGYPGQGVNPWTWLYSAGYKGISWDGKGTWETIGRAGMYLSTGRDVYYNYILQEQKLGGGKYMYRIYNPDNIDFAGVKGGGPEYLRLDGMRKIRNLDIRKALVSTLSLELPGFYQVKLRD